VAQHVVDALEAVQIEEMQREFLPRLLGQLEFDTASG
jgi:hypothetical protein